MTGGFVPKVRDEFAILAAAEVSGAFDTTNGQPVDVRFRWVSVTGCSSDVAHLEVPAGISCDEARQAILHWDGARVEHGGQARHHARTARQVVR